MPGGRNPCVEGACLAAGRHRMESTWPSIRAEDLLSRVGRSVGNHDDLDSVRGIVNREQVVDPRSQHLRLVPGGDDDRKRGSDRRPMDRLGRQSCPGGKECGIAEVDVPHNGNRAPEEDLHHASFLISITIRSSHTTRRAPRKTAQLLFFGHRRPAAGPGPKKTSFSHSQPPLGPVLLTADAIGRTRAALSDGGGAGRAATEACATCTRAPSRLVSRTWREIGRRSQRAAGRDRWLTER